MEVVLLWYSEVCFNMFMQVEFFGPVSIELKNILVYVFCMFLTVFIKKIIAVDVRYLRQLLILLCNWFFLLISFFRCDWLLRLSV